jgi:tetratricopeptide (TPR) repeat protein
MKRLFLLAAALVVATSCSSDSGNRSNAYENPFYAKYLNTGSRLDAEISQTLAALRQNPDSPELHNTLGSLLVEKGFPKDAEREFERAVNLDSDFYPAWYNLGLVRAARGDELGSKRALSRTVDLKPGHAAALFQLGLVEEQRGHRDRAVELYAKAFTINPALLEVDVNPRILDTKLTHLALLQMYDRKHARDSMQFQGGSSSATPQPQAAPSPQPPAETIVAPAAPVTDPAMQSTPAPAPAPAAPRQPRRQRNAPPAPPAEEGIIGGNKIAPDATAPTAPPRPQR